MEISQHADQCHKKFGKTFYEVHLFLDQFASEFHGYAHRRLLHHRLGVRLVVEKFGEEAGMTAELHIRQDTSGALPEDWAEYGEPILLRLEDYERQDVILQELYGEEIFHAVQKKLEERTKPGRSV